MDVRYSPNPETYKRMTTDELRKYFLVDSLFEQDKIYTLYSDADRAIVGSAVPTRKPLKLVSSKKEMAADYFAERREIGIINIGKKGLITADGTDYNMTYHDALYISRGTKDIEFRSANPNEPAAFYILSYPAHAAYPTTHTKFSDGESTLLGTDEDANTRILTKLIHPDGIKSCQLVMGITELHEGCVWNTMSAHTHPRRTEVYLYYNLDENARMFHFFGEPDETRHLVIRNRQAVISPSWSIHCGAATRKYSFIWGMGGENQAFADMDFVDMNRLR